MLTAEILLVELLKKRCKKSVPDFYFDIKSSENVVRLNLI